MEKTLVAKVNNEIDVLMRISGIIRRKGFNMKSIHMEQSTESQADLKIMLSYQDKSVDQLMHQIRKYNDVYEINLV
ncbi:MAG: ACT domain-containing protein [Lutispora sp.]|nr:ACT domain-containing protein [Lutispora sp.]MDD4835466.1 ACT domain-containing protein [Lutispora sp.]